MINLISKNELFIGLILSNCCNIKIKSNNNSLNKEREKRDSKKKKQKNFKKKNKKTIKIILFTRKILFCTIYC